MRSYEERRKTFARAALQFLKGPKGPEDLLAYTYTAASVIRQGDGLSYDTIASTIRSLYDGTLGVDILYVEDDPGVSGAMMTWFKLQNCKVTLVNSSSAALHKLGKDTFDLILTDWNLLGGDTGVRVVEEARARRIPVRVYSGDMPPDQSLKGIWIPKGTKDTNPQIEAFLRETRMVGP